MTLEPLSLLFVRNLFRPADFGGNRYPFEVTRRLAQRGHDVRVVTPRFGGALPGPTSARFLHYPVSRRTPLETFFTNAAFSRIAVARAVRSLRPHLVVLSSYDVAFGHFQFRALDIPTVYTYHSSFRSDSVERTRTGFGVRRLLAPALTAFVRHVELLTYRSATAIVAVSPFSRGEIVAKLGRDTGQIRVIPTGVDVDSFRPGDRAQARAVLGLPNDARVLIGVGRLAPVKRYDRALRAVRLLRDRDPRFRLLLVGEGPEEGELRRLAATLGLEDAVRFEGFRDGAELVRRLVAADVQICTSDFENWSLSLLEGLATGLPVVGVPNGGIPQMLRLVDERLVCRGSEPTDIAERVTAILAQPVHDEIAERARALVVREFSWETIVSRLEDLFRECSGALATSGAARASRAANG